VGTDGAAAEVADPADSPDSPDPIDPEEGGSSIGWLELFFDLVVVAAIAVLTAGLEEAPTLAGVGMFLVLYGAIWLTWTSVVLYANVAQKAARSRPIVLAMFLIAMMAASAPNHFEHRANAFAAGFLIARVVMSRTSLRTGRILASWPLLQFSGLALPWIVAMWFDPPVKYWLWAVGLVFDLLVTVLRGDDDTRRQLDRLTARFEKADAGQRKRPGSKQDSDFHLVAVDVDTIHLDERLGVFVIIVLGEAVSQLVLAAATTGWTRGFVATVTVGFFVLVGLWWITFSYGFAAAPHTRLASMPPRYGLPLHLLSTVGIVCLAAGLGELARAADESLPTSLRWIMCIGLSVHFLSSGIGGVAGGASWRWLTFWSVPSVLVPIATALWGGALPSLAIALILLLPVAWQLLYAKVSSVPPSARR
jgi:low temperature requirement protein LtrA